MEIQFAIQPGLWRSGTERQSAGYWFDSNLIRWQNGVLRPIYGWTQFSPSAVTGAARSMLTWKDNLTDSWIGVGTHSNLYVMNRAGTLTDITPAGYTVGRTDAVQGLGYGGSTYGTGTYGTMRPDSTNIIDATVWSLDTWGQNLVGCTPDDRNIYQWVAPTTGTAAAVLANSPSANALVVTAERFLMALGTTDPRTISWCDQENNTVWTPTVTNQAGSFPLQTFGKLMCGKRLTGGTGIWTDTDMWLATYQGSTLVYGFQKVGSGCGVLSRQAVIASDSQCVWMGPQGFWTYSGVVQALECPVQDYVFTNINRGQVSKVYGVLNSQFHEAWFFYPSASSNEIDSAVVWNFIDNVWTIHRLSRTCGADASGAFTFPLMLNPADQTIYLHENGFNYAGAEPYAETGPLEFAPLTNTYSGQGAKVWQATKFIPDELLEGDVNATFKSKLYPNAPELVFGPYTMQPKTDVRFSGRQVKMRVTGVRADDWRFGTARLEVAGMGDR